MGYTRINPLIYRSINICNGHCSYQRQVTDLAPKLLAVKAKRELISVTRITVFLRLTNKNSRENHISRKKIPQTKNLRDLFHGFSYTSMGKRNRNNPTVSITAHFIGQFLTAFSIQATGMKLLDSLVKANRDSAKHFGSMPSSLV